MKNWQREVFFGRETEAWTIYSLQYLLLLCDNVCFCHGMFLSKAALQKLFVPLTQVWFQNCRARHKKHVSPNHASGNPMTSLQPGRLSQPTPTPEELQYTAYGGPEGSMLSALHSFIDSEDFLWIIIWVMLIELMFPVFGKMLWACVIRLLIRFTVLTTKKLY